MKEQQRKNDALLADLHNIKHTQLLLLERIAIALETIAKKPV